MRLNPARSRQVQLLVNWKPLCGLHKKGLVVLGAWIDVPVVRGRAPHDARHGREWSNSSKTRALGFPVRSSLSRCRDCDSPRVRHCHPRLLNYCWEGVDHLKHQQPRQAGHHSAQLLPPPERGAEADFLRPLPLLERRGGHSANRPLLEHPRRLVRRRHWHPVDARCCQ